MKWGRQIDPSPLAKTFRTSLFARLRESLAGQTDRAHCQMPSAEHAPPESDPWCSWLA